MKLPVNPLLYLVSTACLGGIVHSVIEYREGPKFDSKKIQTHMKVLFDQGTKQLPDTKRWSYANGNKYWERLAKVNFTGKEKKVDKPVNTGPTEPVKPKVSEIIDLSEILAVVCITRGGLDSGVLINYTAEVQVPEEYAAAPAPGPQDFVPKGRRKSGRRGNRGRTMPKIAPVSRSASSSSAPPHPLKVGEALWPPFDYVFLKGVAEDASAVLFELRIEEKKAKDGSFPNQKIFKEVLGLSQEVLESLSEGREGDAAGAVVARRKKAESSWKDLGPKTKIRSGNVHVSQPDQKWLEKNGREIWSSDVVMQDYSSGSGKNKLRGVNIRKVSSRIAQFGVQNGDVLISLNGRKVNGMAHAKKVGRRLYKEGVRSYRAEFLRKGRPMSLVYHFKGDK